MSAKVGWLLDANVFDTYHDELVAAIHRAGHLVRSLGRPDPPYGWDDAPEAYRRAFPRNSCVVTHADIDLVRRVQGDKLWSPGAIATIEHFYCSYYFPRLGRFLLNNRYAMLPFGDLARSSAFLFDALGQGGKLFVRPDSPLKIFTGMVISRETLAKDLDFMAFYEFPIESLVVVSTPKTIVAEWRFVVAKNAIVAGSQYKSGDSLVALPSVDPQALALAQSVLAMGFAPDPVWVMDICQTQDGQYHLLEIGGFSFANLYGCDKDAVVHAVSEIALEIHSSTSSEGAE